MKAMTQCLWNLFRNLGETTESQRGRIGFLNRRPSVVSNATLLTSLFVLLCMDTLLSERVESIGRMAEKASYHHRETAAAAQRTSSGELVDSECPICYQEYNQDSKCPQMLACLHVFCTDCLQRITPRPVDPADPNGPLSISCPLCRRLTPLDTILTSPGDSDIVLSWPPAVIHLPLAHPLPTNTERMALFLEGNHSDSQYIILPTVSLTVQQIHQESTHPPSQVVSEHSTKTILCLQMLAVTFWVLLIITCVVAVVLGPNFLNRPL